MLAVYETIDLGLLSATTSVSGRCSDLLQANHPVFFADPIHEDTLYVYHAFGVHMLQLGPVLDHLAGAIKEEENDVALERAMNVPAETHVRSLLTTFSVERK